jgi:glutaredoxin-like protein
LSSIQHPVTLLLFTQTIGAPESALVTRQILDELASINPLITVEQANLILDKERAAAFGADRVPTIALLRNGEDTRLRFMGAPAGYEFMSLIDAIVLAGTNDSGLTTESRAQLAQVREPLDILVFVTPTCPHCPRAVTLAHRMATENPLIRATCVEATEFIDLSTAYRVTGVPKTVVSGTREILGALPEDQFVAQVLGTDVDAAANAAGPTA